MHIRFSAVWLGFLCTPMLCCAVNASEERADTCENGTQPIRIGVRYTSPKGIGYDQGYSTLEGFFSPPNPYREAWLPFLDIRGHIFNSGKMAANGGVGLRYLAGSRVWGFCGYYDYRNTRRQHYNQISAGLETLGSVWDFRLNGYLPVGKKESSFYNTRFGAFQDHHLLLKRSKDFAMKGANLEAGVHVGHFHQAPLYIAGGPYYLTGKGTSAWGGELRARIDLFDRYVRLEANTSYDHFFRWTGQGQVSLNIPLGCKSRPIRKCNLTCCQTEILYARAIEPVGRNEIIPIGKANPLSVAIDPATGQPYYFVFVNNTSNSDGTYESPYPSLVQAQDNSAPHNIIYVFPGDGTTTGMDAGIFLKANQKLWGSGVSHSLQTSVGTVSISAQSSSSPTITNTDIDTDGNAIILGANNAISGFTITSPLNDAIYGTDPESLEVSSCTFENTTTYAIEASFPGNASISITNNQFLNNVNGIFFTLDGTSTVVCSSNAFKGQTSVSSVPLEIAANSNVFTLQIEHNVFDNNTTGSIRCGFNAVLEADIRVLNNTIINNGTGSQSSLGSSFVVLASGTTDNCSIALRGNTFSNNTSNSLYLHTSGAIASLEIIASRNTMSHNGGSALVLATPVDILTLLATDNTITACDDNGIAIISSGSTTTGVIAINNNTITEIGNASNGIAINQDFSTLDLTILNNAIDGCKGTGIVSYAPTGIGSLTLNISNNTIANCENLSSNAASGLDIEQYTNHVGTIANNTLSGNTGITVLIGSTLATPSICLTLTDNNNSTDYQLNNPVDGIFNLSPCNVDTVNTGTINTSGTITSVQSCPGGALCPP